MKRNERCEASFSLDNLYSQHSLCACLMIYAALFISYICSHISSKSSSVEQAQKVQICLETLAYVYFVMNRAIQPAQTPLFVDLISCIKYDKNFPGLFYQQFFLIRVGTAMHDFIQCVRVKGSIPHTLAIVMNMSFSLVCLLYYCDSEYI